MAELPESTAVAMHALPSLILGWPPVVFCPRENNRHVVRLEGPALAGCERVLLSTRLRVYYLFAANTRAVAGALLGPPCSGLLGSIENLSERKGVKLEFRLNLMKLAFPSCIQQE